MFDFYYQIGNSRRKIFRVKGEVCAIGSARSNDLVLNTKAIAKRHVEMRLLASGLHIIDLGSASGTWINRERVVEYGPLSDLDEIVVGDVSLVLDGLPVITDAIAAKQESKISDAQALIEEAQQENLKPEPKAKRGGFLGFFKGDDKRDAANKHAVKGDAANNGDIDSGIGVRRESKHDNQADFNSTPNFQSRGVNVGDASLIEDNATSSSTSGVSAHQHRVAANEPHPQSAEVTTQYSDPASRQSANTADTTAAIVDNAGESTASTMVSAIRQPQTTEPVVSSFTEQDEQLAYWSGIIHDQLLQQMDLRRKDVNRMSDEQLRQESEGLIASIVEKFADQLPDSVNLDSLRLNVLNEAVGLGPLEQFLVDDDVTEIMVNNHKEIFIEKNGKIVQSPHQFSSDATVYSVIERIITPLGRRIDESSPIVDARLKDGSRVNAVIPPLALKGPSLTIRKFPKYRMQFDDLVRFGSTSQQMVDFLKICVESHKNMIVAGGTGSGKTTLLNVLSNFIPDVDRIVTIEDAAELKLVQPNLVSLESRPPNLEGKGDVPIRDLVRNSLRMRPDRIVVGECRGGEALDMLQAMNTGHDGSLTTIHANTPRDVISRLEVLVLMAGMDLPVTAIREQIASAVHLIIQQSRFPCGSRKITKVTEVVGVESGTVQLQDIFEYKQHGFGEDGKVRGVFRPTGFIPTFYDDLREMGVEVDISCFENSRVDEKP